MTYLLFKALHFIAVISWMAGLLYLPRIFVYHVDVEPGGEADRIFQIMEVKLLRIIMMPAMLVSWVTGLGLFWNLYGFGIFSADFWFYAKFTAVITMTWFHFFLTRRQMDFAGERNTRTGRFYRVVNEVPTLLMIFIVLMVVIKPF